MRRIMACVTAIPLLVLVGAGGAPAQEDVTVPMALAEGDGCYVSPDGAGLWSSLWDEDTLYLEAEDAEALTLQEGHEVLEAADCGGGRCLAGVTHAEYPFEVAEQGRYQAWARTFLPFAGSWSHHESMDGGAKKQIRESNARIFGSWYWSPLGEYALKPGEHTFVLHTWLGGAKIDAIIFSADPEFDPTRLAGVPAGADADTGTIVTRAVLPSAVSQWRSIAWDAELNGGTLAVEASVDGGEAWAAVEGGDLSELPARGDGTDALLARLRLSAGADGASPLLRGATLGFSPAPDAEVALTTEHYRIALARQTGRLAGILNRALAIPATPAHLQQPIVGLSVREPGAHEQTVIAAEEIEFEGIDETDDSLTARYSALDGGIRLGVEITATGTPLSDWTVEVDNRSAMEVIRIDFPLIGEAAIGDFRDDRFVLPETAGRIIDRPATSGKEWMDTYHGGGSMSWIDLCDEDAGLMLHMMDRTLRDTEMSCAPAAGNEAVDLAMRTHTLVRPGETRRREHQIGVHPGDWHWAADAYRDWALSWMKRPENPEWLQWSDGWVGAMGTPFGHMTARLAQARQQGIDHLQYWGQMADGIDRCCGNFYWPAPALGGAEAFRQGIADVQAEGGHVTAYMNCQTWTRDSAINDALRQTPKSALPDEALSLIHPLEWFERWRLYPLDGEPMGYYASTLGWYIMCPASTGFREHLRFWIADMYAERFGIDGVYIDQTGATRSKPCYNLNHGHDDIGAWGWGNVEMLRTSLAAARKTNPEFIIAIEGCGDALGQYAHLHLISGLCTHPEVFHYTFPEYILISGLSNASHLSFHQRISRAFLNGDRFDSRVGRPGLKSALRLRRRIKRWLYPARFMDDIGLRTSDAGVLARWNLCDNDGARAIVVTLDNERSVADSTCALELPEGWEQPRRLFIFDREGGISDEVPQITGSMLQFDVPASTLATALVVYETTPADAVDLWQVVRGEAASALEVAAVNLGDEPLSATVRVEADEPVQAPDRPLELALEPGSPATARIDVAGVEQLEMPTPVTLHVTWPGGERETIAELRPLLLNPSLGVDEDGDGTPDYWLAGGTKTSFERGVADGAAWIQGEDEQYLYFRQSVPLEPNTEYYFAGEVRRSEPESGVSMAVVEHVGERGLRVHRIGDDEAAAANVWERFETTFTTGEAFRECAVYLYNTQVKAHSWYRNLELRPVER